MDTIITCPKCKTEIPLSDAFKREIEAGVLATERARHERELAAAVKAAESAAAKKAGDAATRREKELRAEAAEEKQRSAGLLKQLDELTGELRALRRKDEERELEYKKQLAADEERIRAEARKTAAADIVLELAKEDRELAAARDLASLLRYSLIAVHAERANQAGKDEKMEVLYAYLTSVEFQHRVQAIVEGFTYLFNDVEREKRWFETKWAREEKEIRKIIDSTQGMYGDLQAVTGRSLPTIAALETPEALLSEEARNIAVTPHARSVPTG